MTAHQSKTILIVEPNIDLIFPYAYLPQEQILRITSISEAIFHLNHISPILVFLSASFKASDTVTLLESLHWTYQIVPLILVVDFSNRMNFIPGISWGKRIAVIDIMVNRFQLDSTIERVLLT